MTSMSVSATPSERLERVTEQIERSAVRVGRKAADVTLVAVSKTRSAEDVMALAELGVRHFGENRVQEAEQKIREVADRFSQPLTWHLIGTLQSNKVRAALELFDILQSVDSVRLARAIDRRVPSERRCPVLLEVYVGDDPARPGFRPGELRPAIEQITPLPGLEILGLMTVAPLGLNERETRTVFARLRELREHAASWFPELDLKHLSMGMTDDYPLAVEEGATIVRVGRALFGPRPS
ncbi:MAG: YggS family pyridoxal phosphate-dependent enzyme [Chloroflexi bacterium]|nr:YggS family pyridoxal phosphate-dependent enzyme [Chloroflexota bacterium]